MPNGVKYTTNFIETVGETSTVDQTYMSSPVQTVAGGTNWLMTNVESIGVSAAVKTDGTLWLWGDGSRGRLGNNSTTNRSSPVQTIAATNDWSSVDRRHYFSAAIKTNGTLWLWGDGSAGELGNNSTANQSSPVQTVAVGNNWKQVAVGLYHTVAIKTDGTLWNWGSGDSGELGNNSIARRSSPVQTVSGGTNWCHVAAGALDNAYTTAATTAGVKTDGTLWLWGGQSSGTLAPAPLGNNSTTPRSSPVQTVSATNNWSKVATSGLGSAAIKTDGTLWTWGYGGQGVLGDNTSLSAGRQTPGQTVAGGTNWCKVLMHPYAMGAVKTDGTLWMWGVNGALGANLGDGTTTNKSSPVQTVSASQNWTDVALHIIYGSGGTTTALKNDGTLWNWGYGTTGALGNNGTANVVSPVQTISATTAWGSPLLDVRTVATGERVSAAIKTDGTLWLWGTGQAGILGNESAINQSSPVQTVAGGTNWKEICIGGYFTTNPTAAATKTDGTLWMWGSGDQGQLGNNTNTINEVSPIQTISATTNWKSASINTKHVSAVKTDGTLWTWGYINYGASGNNIGYNKYSSPIQTISGGTNWKLTSAGNYFTAGIKTDGTLWMWGYNGSGQLGTNSLISRSSPVQTVSSGTNWKQVNTSFSSVAAIKTDGTLWLWGYGGVGQLGNNSTVRRSSPVQTVSGGTNWLNVQHSRLSTAAIKTDGTLWLWGTSESGQLGNNSTINHSSPIQTVAGGTNWRQVSMRYHTLAVNTCGELYVWGRNSNGQLAVDLSKVVDTAIKTDVGDILLEKEYLLDVYPNLIPQVKQPALWLWGAGTFGRLGDNSTISKSSPVQTVVGGTNWQSITSGSSGHSAAIKTDGTLWLWGCNCRGELGDSSTINKSNPVQTTSGGTNWKKVSSAAFRTAAIKTDGTLWNWGGGTSGALGNNATANQSIPVQTISATATWDSVSAACWGAVAIKIDGTLWTWGRNNIGQLGNNSTADRSSPIQTVSATTNWRQASASDYNTVAIKTDGTLWTWGCAINGVLGNNSTINQSSPVQTVAAATNWKQVSLAGSTSIARIAAIKTDGTLWVWGAGSGGGLGHNSFSNRSSPVQTVSGGTNWKRVSSGVSVMSAIKTDGTLWTWGSAINGVLGNNSTINQSSPVQTVTGGTNWKSAESLDASVMAIAEQGDW